MPEPTQREVYFAEYDDFLRLRITANNGIMALGVGATLSSHFLQLSSGSKNTLREIFPSVPHIGNFNLKPEVALEELDRAEYLLASMAIPYHLSLLQSFCRNLETLFRVTDTKPVNRQSKKSLQRGGSSVTAKVESFLVRPIPSDTGQVLNLLKAIRDDVMHNGGRATQSYAFTYKNAIEKYLQHWDLKPGGNIPELKMGDKIELKMGDLQLTLAAVKLQAREINFALQESLNRETWTSILVRDYLALASANPMNEAQHLRRCAGLARTKFASLDIQHDEFEVKLLSQLKGKMGLCR